MKKKKTEDSPSLCFMLTTLASFFRTLKFTTKLMPYSLKSLLCMFVDFFAFNRFLFLEMHDHCFQVFSVILLSFNTFSFLRPSIFHQYCSLTSTLHYCLTNIFCQKVPKLVWLKTNFKFPIQS